MKYDKQNLTLESVEKLYNSLSKEQFLSAVKNFQFTPYTLHLRVSKDNSSTDKFIKIESIQDVLCNASCNCDLKFLGIEKDLLFKIDKLHFAILNTDSNKELFHFALLSNKSLSKNQDKLELVTTILASSLEYEQSDVYFSDAVNNEYDEVLKTSECIENEKASIENQLSNYSKDERLEFLENSISNLRHKGLELFVSQNQKDNFIHHCLSEL